MDGREMIGKPDRGGCSSGERLGGGHALTFGARTFFAGGAMAFTSLSDATVGAGSGLSMGGREDLVDEPAILALMGGGGERLEDGERSLFADIEAFIRRGGILETN